jgi:hypothetical protein
MTGPADERPAGSANSLKKLLSHKTVEEAARAAGISASTGWRLMRDPAVLARLREARRDAMQRAMAQLQEAGPEAVEALRKILREAEGESPRVAAARCVLEMCLRAAKLGDIQERLDALEGIVKSRGWKGSAHDVREDQA